MIWTEAGCDVQTSHSQLSALIQPVCAKQFSDCWVSAARAKAVAIELPIVPNSTPLANNSPITNKIDGRIIQPHVAVNDAARVDPR